MSDFNFLTLDQAYGDKQLDILKTYGTKAAITDFYILLGGVVIDNEYTNEGTSLENRSGNWWTKSLWKDKIEIIKPDGDPYAVIPYLGHTGIRPVCTYPIDINKGIKEIEYGEYPQMVASEYISEILEDKYHDKKLKITEKKYTTNINPASPIIPLGGFSPRTHIEYEYDGKKYIRFVADECSDKKVLSDGREIRIGKPYWIKVQPIKWLVDEKTNVILSKKVLLSGIPFHSDDKIRHLKNFDNTEIKEFLDNFFSKEIGTNLLVLENQVDTMESGTITSRKQNPYGFNFEDISEEEIIKGALESGISVFLHGRSSEGKSARVKQIDPDCEIIYLRNATPESLNGKSVYNSETGEMIDVPPTWYKKVKQKCEAEPDKLHIVFFDEITNALPSIQGMAFNIVLDGEINGIWKLPENARIVAAGNDLNDSLAANTMAEPLFNRFAHVYINTTVDSWLDWASKSEGKIHPSVYAYIAYKSFGGQDVLRTPYNGEKPNADPRKWEMASKVLYSTKNPEMLRALIGEDLTRDFTQFCRQQVITVEDVINGNYTNGDLDMNTAAKFATAVGLSSVDENNLLVVRNFVMKMGAEITATFDTLWTHGDEKRLEKIAELKIAELSQGGMRR